MSFLPFIGQLLVNGCDSSRGHKTDGNVNSRGRAWQLIELAQRLSHLAPGCLLGWCSAVGGGFVPAGLECVEEALFDGAGDVGVGFLDLVGEDVAEAECLGDFGNAVVDHPGFVAVP